MARIIVKDGDWDAACAALGASMKAQDAALDARIAARLNPRKKSPEDAAKAKDAVQEPPRKMPPAAPSYQSLLARSQRRG